VTQTAEGFPRTERASGKVIALVGSAGALRPVAMVLADLPADLDAPVLVVLHLHAGYLSNLAAILGRRTLLPVKQAEAGDRPQPGHVYVAAPDFHLRMAADGTLELDGSAPVGWLRPAADVLLLSLAEAFDGGTLAVVLSGTGHDGTAGAAAVKGAGGTVIAQDEESSEFFGMPGAAVAEGVVDSVLPLGDIPAAVAAFVRK